ncbi:MAG: hypothetical protein QOF61_1799 [Acidobacteriota bacterium]|nr:hypothetical protein [Acidobacteriota bacterium]
MPTQTLESSQHDAAALSGDALPELAARDDARLLVQSPHRLFLYWSFAHDQRIALRRAFGARAEQFEMGARLIALEDDAHGEPVAARGHEVWFDARPRRRYRAEVGFFAGELPFVRVLSSNAVQTPSDSVSTLADDTADFQIDPTDFIRLLTTSGFGGIARDDAANIIAAATGVDADAARRVSPLSSFALSGFAPSSFVLGVEASKLRD